MNTKKLVEGLKEKAGDAFDDALGNLGAARFEFEKATKLLKKALNEVKKKRDAFGDKLDKALEDVTEANEEGGYESLIEQIEAVQQALYGNEIEVGDESPAVQQAEDALKGLGELIEELSAQGESVNDELKEMKG